MDDNELLGLLEDNNANLTFEESGGTSSVPKNGNFTKGESWWDKTDITPLAPKVEDFKKSGRSFTVYGIYENKDVLPDTVIEKFIKIGTALANKGFKFRNYGSDTNNLHNKLLEISNLTSVAFLPFPSFNKNIQKPFRKFPQDIAYQIAMHYSRNFTELKPALRAIISSRFNAILGKDCIDPVDILIMYNTSGMESTGKDVDYKGTGEIPRFIKLCGDCDIPYFNIGNEEALPKIVDFIKAIE